jgi:uncharacterized protein (TIGR02118 family)
MYPATDGSTFDWDYYLGPHRELSSRLLTPMGLVRVEVDRGVMAFPPGTPSHFHGVGHLFFNSMEDMERALAAHAFTLVADQRKYFSGESMVQVSEVVESRSPEA